MTEPLSARLASSVRPAPSSAVTLSGERGGLVPLLAGVTLLAASVTASSHLVSTGSSPWMLVLPVWAGLAGLLTVLLALGSLTGPLSQTHHLFEHSAVVEDAALDAPRAEDPTVAVSAAPLRSTLHASA